MFEELMDFTMTGHGVSVQFKVLGWEPTVWCWQRAVIRAISDHCLRGQRRMPVKCQRGPQGRRGDGADLPGTGIGGFGDWPCWPGIHVDGITKEQITGVVALCEEGAHRIAAGLREISRIRRKKKEEIRMVEDLRSAVEELKKYENQIACTDTEVDSLRGSRGDLPLCRGGGTVKRPTKEGPALLFRNIKGFPDKQVLIGLLASRKRVGCLLDCPPDKLGFL